MWKLLHTKCVCLLECECGRLSVSVVATDDCDSAVSCIDSSESRDSGTEHVEEIYGTE